MRITAISAACLALVGISMASDVEAAIRRTTTIQAQGLAPALETLAKDRNFQILYVTSVVSGLRTDGAVGEFTDVEAIERLLSGTGLTYRYVDDETVMVMFAPAASPVSKPAAGASESGPMRLAQSETVFDSKNSQNAENTKRNRNAEETPSGASEGKGEDIQSRATQLNEVLVTGTHIRGAQNNTAPVIILDRQYIEATGLSTVSGLIESLPQNFALATQSGFFVPGTHDDGHTQGSSINLRGIGEGTTLTLLIGRRMAFGFNGSAADISALPLSAIERVEVLTDGASAIYGSDAVGGVVNFILRDNFEGAETALRSGWADGSVNEIRASQVLGNAWSTGNALISVEYYERDLLRTDQRDFVPDEVALASLLPDDENLSMLMTGRQEISERVSVFADALYAHRDSFNEPGFFGIERIENENPQLSAALGVNWDVGAGWQIEASGGYANNELDQRYSPSGFEFNSEYAIESAQLKADGAMFSTPGGDVRSAVGIDWRSESYELTNSFGAARDFDQTVRSAFAEVSVPLVGRANSKPGVRRFELSLAGRYDDYSTFGSSFDPRYGVMWAPADGVKLRATYGTSYVAPSLPNYTFGDNAAGSFFFPDPESPTGVSYLLQVIGSDVNGLSAQEATTFSSGVEFIPPSVPDFQVAVNYYKIEYRGRVAAPVVDIMLQSSANYGALLIRNPTVAQVNEYIAIGNLGAPFVAFDENFNEIPLDQFDPSSIEVIADTRTRNLSRTDTSGLDLSLQYSVESNSARLLLGLNATYVLEFIQQVTSDSPSFDSVDTFYNPPDLRIRGSFGWQQGGWNGSLFANYTDSYSDTRAIAAIPVSSYTTIDARLMYDFGERSGNDLLSNFTAALSIQNLLDEDPPGAAILTFFDQGFDPTNANPMGRLIAIELTKSW